MKEVIITLVSGAIVGAIFMVGLFNLNAQAEKLQAEKIEYAIQKAIADHPPVHVYKSEIIEIKK